MHFLNLPLVTALAATAFALPQDSSSVSENTCGGWTMDNSTYTQYLNPIRVSPGVVCDDDNAGPNGTCPVQVWAFATYDTRLNITVDDAQRDALIDIVSLSREDSAFQLAKAGISGILPNTTVQVAKGKSVVVEFVERYSCKNFQLTNDCQGNLASLLGASIQACYPVYNVGTGTVPMFFSGIGLYQVEVDQETAKSLTDRPYGVNSTDNLVAKGEIGDNDYGTHPQDTNSTGSMPEQQVGNSAARGGISAAVGGAAALIALL